MLNYMFSSTSRPKRKTITFMKMCENTKNLSKAADMQMKRKAFKPYRKKQSQCKLLKDHLKKDF